MMTRCKGCGKDTNDETGFCLACRHTLYTPLLIATMKFPPESILRTMVFPVRDIIWMQDRIRLMQAELAQVRENEQRIGEAARKLAVERNEAKQDLADWNAAHERMRSNLAASLRETQAQLEQKTIEALVPFDDYAYQMEAKSEEIKALTASLLRWRKAAHYYKGGFATMGSAWFDEALRNETPAEQESA